MPKKLPITHLNCADLAYARYKLKWSMKRIAIELNTPYRTYQDWEAGRTRVPGVVSVALKHVLWSHDVEGKRIEVNDKVGSIPNR